MTAELLTSRAIGTRLRGRGHLAGIFFAFAPAPTFAAMALLAVFFAGPQAVICSSMGGAPINDMALMYGLMGVFHARPWARLALPRAKAISEKGTDAPC